MKKLVLVLAMLMVLPAAAFGIQYDLMNDGSMEEVTGQAGVSIAMDDIQLFLNIERVAWLDCDGYTCVDGTSGAGAVGIGNFQLDVLTINAIDFNTDQAGGVWDLTNAADCSQIDLRFNYGDTGQTGTCFLATTGLSSSLTDSYFASLGSQHLGLDNYESLDGDDFVPSALTIDATSQLPVLTEIDTANGGGNQGGVLIGLPTIEIYIPSLTMTPEFYNIENETEPALNAAQNSDASFGTIQLDGVTMSVLSGWIEIAPH